MQTKGNGWYSFDQNGVHFIGLVNVVDLKAGGLGSWATSNWNGLEDDVAHLANDTPIRGVCAHSAVVDLSRLGLGHRRQRPSVGISEAVRLRHCFERSHPIRPMQKIEGTSTFHNRHGPPAFPSPPGSAPSPAPMKVPDEKLRSCFGLTSVNYVQGKGTLAIIIPPWRSKGSHTTDNQSQESAK